MGVLETMTRRKLMIVVLGFMVEFICWGLFYSFAMFYSFLVVDFNTSFAFMGLVGTSVSTFGTMLGPLPGLLVLKTSYGFVIFVVGIMVSCALFITSYDVYGWQVLFTYSVLFGVANGLSIVTFNYFIDNLDNDFALAVSVTTSAAGFGLIFFSCLANYYLESTDGTWRQLFRYFAVSGLLIAASSVGFHYLHDPKSSIKHSREHYGSVDDENDLRPALRDGVRPEGAAVGGKETDSLLGQSESGGVRAGGSSQQIETQEPPKNDAIHGWELLFSKTDHRAKYLALAHIFMFAASNFPLKICFYYAISVSSNEYLYYYMSVALGCGIIFSRLVTSFLQNFIGDKYLNSGIVLTKVAQVGAFVTLVILSLYSPEEMTLMGVVLGFGFYAFFQAGCITLVPLRTVEILGTDHHLINVGVQFFSLGVSMSIGSYSAGAVYDATSSFQWVFAFCALFFPLSILVDDLCFKQASLFYYLKDSAEGHKAI